MKKRGFGIGSTFYGTGYGNGFLDVSQAEIELNEKGNLIVYVGATEVGQGAKTVLSQMAAEILKLRVEEIELICEDTAITPDAGTAAASRQTYNTGNAVKRAAEGLRTQLLEVAAQEMKLNTTEGLEMEGGIVFLKTYPRKQVSFKTIVEVQGGPLRQKGSFTAQTINMEEETGQGAPYWPYTYSAYGVEVEVDLETGVVEVVRALCAQDVGRAINPNLIEGQIDGGFAMGLGYALLEDLQVVKGEIRHNRFSNYLLPTALDVVDVEKMIVEEPDSTGPFGAKGIGEPVTIGVAPAILNAVYDAVGVRVTEIPLTPEKLLKALKDQKGNGEAEKRGESGYEGKDKKTN